MQPVWNWLRGFAQSALSTVLEEEEGEGEEEEYGSSCCSSSGQDCCKSTAALREDVVVSNGDVSISNCAAAIATTAPSRSDVTDEEKVMGCCLALLNMSTTHSLELDYVIFPTSI